MRAADRVEGGVHASPGRELPYGRDEIACAIVDRRRAEALDRGAVRGRAGPDRPEAEMPREIEQAVPTVPEAPTTRIVAPGARRR